MSVTLGGVRTSVSLEDAFWTALKEIAQERGVGVGKLIEEIAKGKAGWNLSSSLRLFVLGHFKDRLAA